MSDFERPHEPRPQARKRSWIWWAFALHLAVCYFMPAFVARNDYLFSLERRGGDVYYPILAVIGGIIMATIETSWILRTFLFIPGYVISYAILLLSATFYQCAFQQLCS
jgi:hypothetical protein